MKIAASETLACGKPGAPEREFEDAVATTDPKSRWTFRAAVADGAASTAFARKWAHCLVSAFCGGDFDALWTTDGRPPTALMRPLDTAALDVALEAPQTVWSQWVSQQEILPFDRKNVQVGAAATVAGLVLRDDRRGFERQRRWAALLIGDSCLARITRKRLRFFGPYTRSTDFSTRVPLVCSRPRPRKECPDAWRTVAGDWEIGDSFLLMTDAVSKWWLQEYERRRRVELFENLSRAQFQEWVYAEQRQNRLNIDDVTVHRISV